MPKFNKSKGFTLKSGNKIEPISFFKGETTPSQSSGIYYKSPLEAEDNNTEEEVEEEVEEEDVDDSEGEEEKETKKPDKPGTKAWKIAANALIGGFDAVTGEKTKRPTINWGKHKKEEEDGSPESNVKDLLDPAKLTQEEKDEGLSLFEGQKMSSADNQFDYSDMGKNELTDMRKQMKGDGSWDVKGDPQAKAIQNKINELYGSKTKH